MTFTIDEDSLLIKGRKGDTASFTFDFEFELSNYTVCFYVKKNINSPNAVIEKKYAGPSGKSVTVILTSEDTGKLISVTNSYNTYFWGLKNKRRY